jgi:hypothetical protein
MQTDLAIEPAGDVWVMNSWQDIDSCFGAPSEGPVEPLRRSRRHDFLRDGEAGTRTPDRACPTTLSYGAVERGTPATAALGTKPTWRDV